MRIEKNIVSHAVLLLCLSISALIIFMPVLIVFFTSLKTAEELTVENFGFFPKSWRFENFRIAMGKADWGRYYFNSGFVTVTAVLGSLVLNSLAGYSFARLQFKGRDLIFIFFLIGIMIPPQSIIIPQFIIMKSIPLAGGNDLFGSGGRGWLNTYAALIIPELSGSFGIFLCRQFYLGFPKSLDEAARIDGASQLKVFLRIYLPLSGPVLATLTILKTVHMWNNFFYPLIMTTGNEMQTVQLALANFRGENLTRWEIMTAAAFISILPILAVFLAAQKYYIRGIVSAGIKG